MRGELDTETDTRGAGGVKAQEEPPRPPEARRGLVPAGCPHSRSSQPTRAARQASGVHSPEAINHPTSRTSIWQPQETHAPPCASAVACLRGSAPLTAGLPKEAEASHRPCCISPAFPSADNPPISGVCPRNSTKMGLSRVNNDFHVAKFAGQFSVPFLLLVSN